MIKVEEGGWFPIVVGVAVYILMTTWNRGRARLQAIVRENTLQMDLFLSDVARRKPPRVPGTAVFLTSNIGGAPPVLLHHLKHNKVLHEKVILISVVTEEIPVVDEDERVECKVLGEGFYKVIARYGFMESPDIPQALANLGAGPEDGQRVRIKAMETSFFLGRETLIATRSAAHQRAGARCDRADVDVAEAAVHPHDSERALGDRVLRVAAQPGGGAGGADTVLTATVIPSAVRDDKLPYLPI